LDFDLNKASFLSLVFGGGAKGAWKKKKVQFFALVCGGLFYRIAPINQQDASVFSVKSYTVKDSFLAKSAELAVCEAHGFCDVLILVTSAHF